MTAKRTTRTNKETKKETKKLSPLINIASLWVSKDDEGNIRETKDGRTIYSGVLLNGAKIRAFRDNSPENNRPNITICLSADELKDYDHFEERFYDAICEALDNAE